MSPTSYQTALPCVTFALNLTNSEAKESISAKGWFVKCVFSHTADSRVAYNKNMIKMYTTTWCPDCTAAKSVLKKRGLEFDEINIEQDDAAAQYVMQVNGGKRSVPTLVIGEDAVSLSGFSRAKLDVFLQKHNLA